MKKKREKITLILVFAFINNSTSIFLSTMLTEACGSVIIVKYVIQMDEFQKR